MISHLKSSLQAISLLVSADIVLRSLLIVELWRSRDSLGGEKKNLGLKRENTNLLKHLLMVSGIVMTVIMN